MDSEIKKKNYMQQMGMKTKNLLSRAKKKKNAKKRKVLQSVWAELKSAYKAKSNVIVKNWISNKNELSIVHDCLWD